MEIIRQPISAAELLARWTTHFQGMTKGVVDVRRGLLAVDAPLHSDLEALLLEDGSRQEDLWGLNLYPAKGGEDFIEYTALINIRPGQGNPSMEISDPDIRQAAVKIVGRFIHDAG